LKPLHAVAWIVPPAFAWLCVDMFMDAGRLGPRELATIALRLTLWLLPLPLLQRIPARSAATTVAGCALSALLADFLFVSAMTRLGPPRYMYLRPGLTPIECLRLALRFIEPALLITIAATIAARWSAARELEREQAVRASALKARLADARLQLLRSQLHPHFLFNSLNSIAALIRTDREGAAGMLGRLQRFYSVVGAASDRLHVTLDEELSLVREYLAIEQIRFGPRLAVSIDAEGLDAAVPPLLLQPLVENAVKHGVSRMPGNGFVHIEAKRAGRSLHIVIENRADESHEAAGGVGLANTRAQLEAMYGTAASLTLLNDAERFRVTLTIPEVA
jgi:sensor histidine kinase YesM